MSNGSCPDVKMVVFYVGTSLLAPLKKAEHEICERGLKLIVAVYNGGLPWSNSEWQKAENDLSTADIVLIMHLTDSENTQRLMEGLDRFKSRHHAVVVFNCLADLMRKTRIGRLDFNKLINSISFSGKSVSKMSSALRLSYRLATWMSDFMSRRFRSQGKDGSQSMKGGFRSYHKLTERLPRIIKFIPSIKKLRDIKNYLVLYCYFLQPTPKNICSMLLYSIKHYVPGYSSLAAADPPEIRPTTGIYHPEAPQLFENFEAYQLWYEREKKQFLSPERTIGLLLMRPQIVSEAHSHYDELIEAIEAEGLGVIAAISTFMDNRQACRAYFLEGSFEDTTSPENSLKGLKSRVSQIVSLTGFSFVGGPVMNDTEASIEFLKKMNVPFRSIVSLDLQTIENWQESHIGLNPVQTAMQVAIPELDGATESRLYGGVRQQNRQPEALPDRCSLVARRLARWNRLQITKRHDLRLALLVFCFPPNKGNLGTAADLDVFPSLIGILQSLKSDGYDVQIPENSDLLRKLVLEGNSQQWGTVANVHYQMSVDEYKRLCPYVTEIEQEWGRAPGKIDVFNKNIMILGAALGNVFIGVQPTFGYEGDPMRLLAEKGGTPHHGFMALYSYLEKVYCADVIIHVGTHGAAEFMPGKQVGLSSQCWPDRLIGEMPHLYLYSVNNPSEGTIAKRRTSAELVSYLTPPIDNAGLYKELTMMKELLNAYRKSTKESERAHLFAAIESQARELHLS